MPAMTTRTQLLPLAAALAAAAALPAATGTASAADLKRGTYSGRTAQPAAGAARPFAGAISLKLGLVSNPARIVRFSLTTRLACADGTTRDDRVGGVVYGPRLDARGRFSYVGDGFVVRGRFKPDGTAAGTAERTVGDCSVAGVSWTARR